MRYVNYHDFSIYHIKLFLALCENLNYTKAADECYVTQSTLSRIIMQLENMLGIQLFIRSTSKVILTPAGRSLYKDLRRFYGNVEHSVQTAYQIQEGKSCLLTVGVSDGMNISAELLPFLKEFQEKHKSFEITFTRDLENCLTKKLCEHACDVVFDFTLKEIDTETINEKPLFSGPLMLYMLKTNPLCQKETISIADLQSQMLMIRAPSLRPEGIEVINNLLGSRGIKPRFAAYVPNALDLSLNINKDNQSIIADQFFIDRYSPFLTARPIENTKSTIWVRWMKEFAKNKNTDLFVQEMLEYFEKPTDDGSDLKSI